MKRLLLIALLLLASTAWAADDSVLGTHWVKFEPFQVAGQLKGCSLVYMAVVADRMYLKGDLVAANGAIRIEVTAENRLAMGDLTGGETLQGEVANAVLDSVETHLKDLFLKDFGDTDVLREHAREKFSVGCVWTCSEMNFGLLRR